MGDWFYSPISIVKDLHEIPRYDFSFERVTILPNFDPADAAYYDTLIFAAGAVAACLTLVFLVSFFAACCAKSCETRSRRGKPRTCQRRTLTCVGLLMLVCGVCGFLHNNWFHGKIGKTLDLVSDTTTVIQNNVDVVATVDMYVPLAENEVSRLQQQLATAPPYIQNDLTAISAALPIIKSRADAAVSALRFDVTDIINEIRDDEKYRDWGFVGVLGLVLLQGLIATFCICGRPWKLLCCHTFILWVLFFVFMVLTSVMMAVLLFVSDTCYDPNTFIMYNFQTSSNEQYFQYYMYCETAFPRQGDINTLFSKLGAANSSAESVYDYVVAQGLSTQYINALLVNVNALYGIALVANTSFDCNIITPDYYTALRYTCNGGVTEFFSLFTFIFVFTFFVIVAAVTNECMKHARGRYLQQSDEEEPLIAVVRPMGRETNRPIPLPPQQVYATPVNSGESAPTYSVTEVPPSWAAPGVRSGECQICMTSSVNRVLNCGHCLCSNCLFQCQSQKPAKCPFCRATIVSSAPIFIP